MSWNILLDGDEHLFKKFCMTVSSSDRVGEVKESFIKGIIRQNA